MGFFLKIQREDVHHLGFDYGGDIVVGHGALHVFAEYGDGGVEVGGLLEGEDSHALFRARLFIYGDDVVFYLIIFVAGFVEENLSDLGFLYGGD